MNTFRVLLASATTISIVGCLVAPISTVHAPSAHVDGIPCDATAVARGDALRHMIEVDAVTSITLCPGLHRVTGDFKEVGVPSDGIWIDYDDLTIQGDSSGSSVVLFERDVYLGFVIRSGVENLTITGFEIRGSLAEHEAATGWYVDHGDTTHCEAELDVCFSLAGGKNPPTYGIGTYGGVEGVRNIRLSDLTMSELAVAIGITPQTGSSCVNDGVVNVTIEGNHIFNIHGVDSGTGYGIVTSCAENVLVIDNLIQRTMRHAIYHGRTGSGNPADDVRVIRNTVVDHGHLHGAFTLPNRSAVALARGDNMSAVANTIVRSHTQGIEIADVGVSAANIHVIGNHFIDTSDSIPNIWLDTDDVVYVWGNENTRRSDEAAYVDVDGTAPDTSGSGFQGMAVTESSVLVSDTVYVARGSSVYKYDADGALIGTID